MHTWLSERLWLDDLSRPVVASRSYVKQALIDGVTSTSDLLAEEHLELASKSTITCSSMTDTKSIVEALKRRGITAQCSPHVSYLG